MVASCRNVAGRRVPTTTTTGCSEKFRRCDAISLFYYSTHDSGGMRNHDHFQPSDALSADARRPPTTGVLCVRLTQRNVDRVQSMYLEWVGIPVYRTVWLQNENQTAEILSFWVQKNALVRVNIEKPMTRTNVNRLPVDENMLVITFPSACAARNYAPRIQQNICAS